MVHTEDATVSTAQTGGDASKMKTGSVTQPEFGKPNEG